MAAQALKKRLHRISRIAGIVAVTYFIFSALFVSTAWAMDADLWHAPQVSGSKVLWKDRTLEINGISARGTHSQVEGNAKGIINFYQNYYLERGWQIKDCFQDQNIIAFMNEDKFMYVAVQENGEGIFSDVYLIGCKADLAICRMISSLMRDGVLIKDAPGKDAPGIPRYPDSKRMISIKAPEEGNILFYQVPGEARDIAEFYKRRLNANGWNVVQPFTMAMIERLVPKANDMAFCVFEKDNNDLVLHVFPMRSNKKKSKYCIVSIVKNMSDEFSYPIGGGE